MKSVAFTLRKSNNSNNIYVVLSMDLLGFDYFTDLPIFSTTARTLPFSFRLDSESGSSICRFLFRLFVGF